MSYGRAGEIASIIVSKRMKIYQKQDRSKNDKNRVVGSYQVSIPKEIVNALKLRSGDKVAWIVGKQRRSAIMCKP